MNRFAPLVLLCAAAVGRTAAADDGPRELVSFPQPAFDWLLDGKGGAVVTHGWAVRAVTAVDLARGTARRVAAKVPGDGYGRAVSPSGRFLAVATTAPGVELVDLAAGATAATYSVRTRNDVGDVAAILAVADDGRTFTWQGLAPGAAGEIRAWGADGARGAIVTLGVGEVVEALALSADSSRLYAATRAPDGAGGLLLVDAARNVLLRRHRLPAADGRTGGQRTGLAVASGGRRVVASAVDGASRTRSLYAIDAASLEADHASAFRVPLPAEFLAVPAVVVDGPGARAAVSTPGKVTAAESGDPEQWLSKAASSTGTVVVVDLAAAEAAVAANAEAPDFRGALLRVGRVSPLGVGFGPGGGLRILLPTAVVAVGP